MADETINSDYPHSTTSPNAPITADRAPAMSQQTNPSTTAGAGADTAHLSVGALRKQHGPHFAEGYGDNDPIGKVLSNAGVATLDEYLAREQRD